MDEALRTIAPTTVGAIFFLGAAFVVCLIVLGIVVFATVQAVRKRGRVRIFCLMVLTAFALETAWVALSVSGLDTSASGVVTTRPYLFGSYVLLLEGVHLASVVGAVARKGWSPPLFALYVVANVGE